MGDSEGILTLEDSVQTLNNVLLLVAFSFLSFFPSSLSCDLSMTPSRFGLNWLRLQFRLSVAFDSMQSNVISYMTLTFTLRLHFQEAKL